MTTIAPIEAGPLPQPALLASPATRRLLVRYAARRVPPCDVEDVVQATLTAAISSGRAPRGAQALQRWLLSIARFKVVDAQRAAGRRARAEPGELVAPAPPVEAMSLLRWAERVLPRGAATEATLRWMLREAEGDQLEAIAADEAMPAERVRQRVSRLRRWMRERWMLELAAVTVLAVVIGAVAAAARPGDGASLPEIAAEPSPRSPTEERPAADPRLTGTWKLAAFTPSAPLPADRKALVDRLSPSFTATFDGTTVSASAGPSFARSYKVTTIGGGKIEAVNTASGYRFTVSYAWDGADLLLTVPSGKWAGVARLRPVR